MFTKMLSIKFSIQLYYLQSYNPRAENFPPTDFRRVFPHPKPKFVCQSLNLLITLPLVCLQ